MDCVSRRSSVQNWSTGAVVDESLRKATGLALYGLKSWPEAAVIALVEKQTLTLQSFKALHPRLQATREGAPPPPSASALPPLTRELTPHLH